MASSMERRESTIGTRPASRAPSAIASAPTRPTPCLPSIVGWLLL
jgi:hypothetical protein